MKKELNLDNQNLPQFLENKELSVLARFILLIALEEQKTINLSVEYLMEKFDLGEKAIYGALNLLKKYKYLKTERIRADNGKFGELIYKFYQTPFK